MTAGLHKTGQGEVSTVAGVAIGDAIGSATANAVLGTDASGNLTNATGFRFNPTGVASSYTWVGIGSGVGTSASALGESLLVKDGAGNSDVISLVSAGSNARLRAKGSGGTNGVWFGQAATALQLNNGDGGTLDLMQSGTTRWQVNASGHLIGGADNTYDIGANGLTRPRSIYVATSLVVNTPLQLQVAGTPSRCIAEATTSGYIFEVRGRQTAGETTNPDIRLGGRNDRTAGWLVHMGDNLDGTFARLWALKYDGRAFISIPNSAPTDGDLQNSEITWYWDDATPALKARIKRPGSTLLTLTVTNAANPTLA